MKKINLDSDQEKLMKILKTIPIDGEDEHYVFLITGTAGSGKTSLISEAYNELSRYDEIIVASLTGKACQVLRTKGVGEARTIQSFLFGKPRISIKISSTVKLKIKDMLPEQIVTAFQEWNSVKVDLKTYKKRLFIFDEASMIIDVESGSRNKLSQLDEIYKKINNSKGPWHILMVGDRNQLPPPVSPRPEDKPVYSEALSKDYWSNKREITKVLHFNLENSHRQDKQSNIYKFINTLRDGEDHEPYVDRESVSINNVDDDVGYQKVADYLEEDITSAYFISSTNYGMYRANKQIRAMLGKAPEKATDYYKGEAKITKGDLLLVSETNYFHSLDLFNGDPLKVVSEPNYEKVETITVEAYPGELIKYIEKAKTNAEIKAMASEFSSKKELQEYKRDRAVFYKDSFTQFPDWFTTIDKVTRELHFLKIKVEHLVEGRRSFDINLLLNSITLPEVGNSKAMDLEEEIINLCIMQRILEEHNTEDEGPDNKNSKKTLEEKLKEDKRANAVWASWGYAGTCHKAQGSEWDHVVVDLNYSDMFEANWVYTAFTRALKSLTILSFDQRQKGFKASNENIEEVDDLDKFLNDIDGYEGVEGTPLEKSDSRESPFDVLKNLKPWNKGQENKGQQCDHIWELVDYGEPQQLKCQNCSRTFYSSDPNAPF